jgi:transposase
MSYHFLPYAQEQMYLMPPAITAWVAEGSLAWLVSEILEALDRDGTLAPFYDQYREDGWGSAAYHPLMMVKVLVYGYSVGITSSRRLAQALEDQVAFRYLSANQSPDFRTIAEFRKRHLTALEGLFVRVLRLCREAGLVTMGRVALDGRKVVANAALADNTTELFIGTTKEWKQRQALREKGCPRGRIPTHATVKDRMERKLLTRVGQAVYQLRSCTIEPVFGQMSMRGLTRCRLRGFENVRVEWSLWCSTHNLLKLWRAGFVPSRALTVASG